MRTTIDLPDSLFREVKCIAAQRGLKLKEFIAESLVAALNGGQAAGTSHTAQEQHRQRVEKHIAAMKKNRIQTGSVGSFNRDQLYDRHD